MENFKSSVLTEEVSEYVPPVNDDNATSSDESEANTSAEDESNPEDTESEGSELGHELAKGNSGWADAMSKILKTNKPKKKRTVVLSRAKKLSAAKPSVEKGKAPTFEIEGEIKKEEVNEKEEPEQKLTIKDLPKVRRKEWESRGRIKPVYPDSEREKSLSKIAIKGVVQLFNAVQKHQSAMEHKLKSVGASEVKRERILKSVDKRAFLDVLMGNSKSEAVSSSVKTEEIQLKEEEPQSAVWSVLRDDFMSDPTLKDWDKETGNGENEDMSQESLSSEDDDDMT